MAESIKKKDLCPYCKKNMKMEYSKRCIECFHKRTTNLSRGRAMRKYYERKKNKSRQK